MTEPSPVAAEDVTDEARTQKAMAEKGKPVGRILFLFDIFLHVLC